MRKERKGSDKSSDKSNEDRITVDGWVELMVTDSEGRVKAFRGAREDKNVITYRGVAAIIRLVFENFVESRFRYIAIGTGTAIERPDQIMLVNEIKRKAANALQITTDIQDDTVMLETLFSQEDGLTGIHNIAEVGVFNDPTSGIMLARKTHTPITVNWDLGDNLYVRYFIQIRR